MSRVSLLVLACVSVVFARGPGPMDGKNVTISAKGRALCSGAPIQGSVKLILFDTRCDTRPLPPRITTLADAKVDENGKYRIEASLVVPTHGGMGGRSTIYLNPTNNCGRNDSPFGEPVPTEYWNVQGAGKKVFDHDFVGK